MEHRCKERRKYNRVLVSMDALRHVVLVDVILSYGAQLRVSIPHIEPILPLSHKGGPDKSI